MNWNSQTSGQPTSSPYQQQPHPYQSSANAPNPSYTPASSYPTFRDSYQQIPNQQTQSQVYGYPSLQQQYGQMPYNPSPYSSVPARTPIAPNTTTYHQGQYSSLPFQYHPPPYYGAGPPQGVPKSYIKPVNLISNPNFEARRWNENGDTVEMNTVPWNIINTGGDGWKLEKIPMGSKVTKCPDAAGPGAHCVAGSFDWCKRSQTINLEQKGFSTQTMDKEKPRIQVYEWFIARSDCDSEYYVKVTLLDKDERPIDHFNSGIIAAGSAEWHKVEHNFYNYPPGVRYIQYEDGTKDKKFWAGHFGAKMCQPTVLIHSEFHGGHNDGRSQASPYANVSAPTAPYSQYPGTQYPGSQNPGTQYPGAQYPGTQYPGSQKSGTQYSGSPNPGTQYPGAQYPGTQYPGSQKSGTQYAGSQNPGTQYPVAQYPGTQYPGAQYPGTQYPGSQNPGTQYPGTQFPGTQYPGAQSSGTQSIDHKPGYPQSGDITVNLIKNPSFTPVKWEGDLCHNIDFSPWVLEQDGGYCLEKKPIGARVDKYPVELEGFDIWCASTSHFLNERKQTIDLIQNGFSAMYLDDVRPAIKIYEWFTSRSDCEGKYFLKVSLLDQQKQPILGCCFNSGLKEAPCGTWHKEEHIFTAVPSGVRFIEFIDGGSDCKNWAGFYGTKMVGAFAGVITNKSFSGSPSHHVPAKPVPRNLLKNANLMASSSWNGNVTSDIESQPWEIISNKGDGIQLERTAEGTAAGPYPPEADRRSNCIATSFDWFKRVQIVDLLENGVVPHMFDNPDLKIYACEWFASRTDNEGEYYLKVSLLNEHKQEIPGYTFDSHVDKAPSDEWEKVDYSFFPVPDTARYVRFEDGGKDTKYWAGRYGVKMFGAAVYAGQKHDSPEVDCAIM